MAKKNEEKTAEAVELTYTNGIVNYLTSEGELIMGLDRSDFEVKTAKGVEATKEQKHEARKAFFTYRAYVKRAHAELFRARAENLEKVATAYEEKAARVGVELSDKEKLILKAKRLKKQQEENAKRMAELGIEIDLD